MRFRSKRARLDAAASEREMCRSAQNDSPTTVSEMAAIPMDGIAKAIIATTARAFSAKYAATANPTTSRIHIGASYG